MRETQTAPDVPVYTRDSPDARSGLVIESSRGWSSLRLSELWGYRELVYFLVWREIKGRYRQTALGTSWLFLRPIAGVLVLSVVFGGILGVPSDDLPYPLFAFAALLPWGYFAAAVQRSAGSLVEQRHIIGKVYFPRLVLPLAATLSGLVDFAAAFLVFIGAVVVFQVPLRPQMLFVPVFLLVAVGFALAVGLWLATLSAKYQDVSFGVNFLVQALMYLSPVIYSVTIVPENLRLLYALNPMTGVIQGFRWALLGTDQPPVDLLLISMGIITVGILTGAYVFRRTERTIVDIL